MTDNGSGDQGDAARRLVPSIDVALVRRLVAGQFPQWADLPITPVEHAGWDNITFRLGDDMTVRVPRNESYRQAVDKEHRWLPILAPHLPLQIPTPLAKGLPAEGYPFGWSVYRWLDGSPAGIASVDDLSVFATTLAGFLNDLMRVDPTGGPPAGEHNFFRGAPLDVYDGETREAVDALRHHIDAAAATEVWDTALAATWQGAPVWFHGDVAAGNLLVRDGRLAAVIDFGTSAIGDPACDTTIAWTLLSGDSREVFRATLNVDNTAWARGRGWALWKSLITLARDDGRHAAAAGHVLDEVLSDHERSGRNR